MAGPVGHIVCALALIKAQVLDIKDTNAFILGTNWPDVRYITDINRSTTHFIADKTLEYLAEANSDFEKGRRFHVLVDIAREKHMQKYKAYDFIPKMPAQSKILKIVEDDLLFERLKSNNFDASKIFNNIHKEELEYGLLRDEIERWHNLLKNYLKTDYKFDFFRYYSSLSLFQNPKDMPEGFWAKNWYKVKKFAFFLSVYFKIKWLKEDEKLRKIIFDFYDNPINIMFPPKMEEIALLDLKPIIFAYFFSFPPWFKPVFNQITVFT